MNRPQPTPASHRASLVLRRITQPASDHTTGTRGQFSPDRSHRYAKLDEEGYRVVASITEEPAIIRAERSCKLNHMGRNFLTLILLAYGIGGCTIPSSLNPFSSGGAQAERSSSPSLAWARNDSQLITGSPELTARAKADISECGAVTPPVRTHSGVVGEDCMKARGYDVREIP